MAKKNKTAKKKPSKARAKHANVVDLEEQIEELKAMIDGRDRQIEQLQEQLEPAETASLSMHDPHSSEVTVYDVAACMGVIRDRINGYPLNDDEFNQIAPDHVRHAVQLAYMIQEEMQRVAQGVQQLKDEAEDQEQNPAPASSPTLP